MNHWCACGGAGVRAHSLWQRNLFGVANLGQSYVVVGEKDVPPCFAMKPELERFACSDRPTIVRTLC